jgi:hypothetical protein
LDVANEIGIISLVEWLKKYEGLPSKSEALSSKPVLPKKTNKQKTKQNWDHLNWARCLILSINFFTIKKD